jgi:glycosyltransferase involved in cell wall biosynthesis
MISGKAHLMPWRVIREVANSQSDPDIEVFIVSLTLDTIRPKAPDGVFQIPKDKKNLANELQRFVANHSIDVVVWPVTWHELAWRIRVVASLPVARVAYFPGGVYDLAACLYALRRLGLRMTLPYLLDSLIRPQRLIRHLARAGFTDLIALSELTAKVAAGAGWPQDRTHWLLPGKDAPEDTPHAAIPRETAQWLGDDAYLLFMGPPSRVRGIFQLLTAFEIAARQNTSIRLICLFRKDDKLDSDAIRRTIERSAHRERIHVVWESINRPELLAFMRGALAIVMPFILVPSEIPLAIIEAIAFGKPVITTSPGGTGEFVSQFGFAPTVGDTTALADAMLTLVGDQSIREDKAQRARDIYAQLNDWRGIADRWLAVARRALADRKAG